MIKKKMWDAALCLMATLWLLMGVGRLLCGWANVFSYRAFWILSGSMEPVVHENQAVIGTLAGDRELEPGNIYAYQREGAFGKEMVIHRLVEIREDGTCIFKGDHNRLPDVPVERGQVGYLIVWY